MKPEEVLGLSILLAVHGWGFDSALLTVASFGLFGVWAWASLRQFHRELKARESVQG